MSLNAILPKKKNKNEKRKKNNKKQKINIKLFYFYKHFKTKIDHIEKYTSKN